MDKSELGSEQRGQPMRKDKGREQLENLERVVIWRGLPVTTKCWPFQQRCQHSEADSIKRKN